MSPASSLMSPFQPIGYPYGTPPLFPRIKSTKVLSVGRYRKKVLAYEDSDCGKCYPMSAQKVSGPHQRLASEVHRPACGRRPAIKAGDGWGQSRGLLWEVRC